MQWNCSWTTAIPDYKAWGAELQSCDYNSTTLVPRSQPQTWNCSWMTAILEGLELQPGNTGSKVLGYGSQCQGSRIAVCVSWLQFQTLQNRSHPTAILSFSALLLHSSISAKLVQPYWCLLLTPQLSSLASNFSCTFFAYRSLEQSTGCNYVFGQPVKPTVDGLIMCITCQIHFVGPSLRLTACQPVCLSMFWWACGSQEQQERV